MMQDEVRAAIQSRILEQRQLMGSSNLLVNINNTIKKHAELSAREKDFAFRSSVESRTLYQWAAYYGVSYMTIWQMQNKDTVKKLKEEIQFDIRKYTVGMQIFLLREAMTQYLKIFRIHENTENIEAKRKAAKEVMSWFGMAENPDGGSGKPLNVNIFNDKQGDNTRSINDDDTVSLSVSQLEKEMQELKMLEDLRNKVGSENSKARSKIKEGGGFADGAIPDITID